MDVADLMMGAETRETYLRLTGVPEFLVELDRHSSRSPLLQNELRPLGLVLNSSETRLLFAQLQDAARSLWRLLRQLAEEVGAASEEEFLLGFVPKVGVRYDNDDVRALGQWHHYQAQLYRWGTAPELDCDNARSRSPDYLVGARQELLELLDDLDGLLVPRLRFWQKVSPRDGGL